MTDELCPCGEPLHYSDPGLRAIVESIIALSGRYMTFTTPEGSWRVPRHWVALHGLKAAELPELAARYSWEAAPGGVTG